MISASFMLWWESIRSSCENAQATNVFRPNFAIQVSLVCEIVADISIYYNLVLKRTDDYSIFRKIYEIPILKSRSPCANQKEIELGEAQAAQVRLSSHDRCAMPMRYSCYPLPKTLSFAEIQHC